MLRLTLITALALCIAAVPLPAQQQAITNDSVVQMTKAGLGDALIIQSINATPSNFSTSTSDLIALKQAGVSERVIGAMVAKNAAPPPIKPPSSMPDGRLKLDMPEPPPAPPPAVPADFSLAGVEEMGVYYKAHDGKWIPMEPELLIFRSGGALKSYGTDHLIKEDNNGHLMGPTSPLALTRSTPILLYMPVGTSPIEFLLLRFRSGAQHSREFRSQTGGVFHSQSGAMRDRIVFNATRVSRQIYTFNLPDEVGKGEYGILPPNSGGNAGFGGKIFTFKIIE
jgi:hypothetical protein